MDRLLEPQRVGEPRARGREPSRILRSCRLLVYWMWRQRFGLASLRRRCTQPLADRLGYTPRIPTDTVDHGRGWGVQEVLTDEIEAGLAGNHSSVLDRFAVRIEHWQIDPF